MDSRRRFLAAVAGEQVDHAPVWVMRQAGRHLPEYMRLRERYSFHELVKTPELACEVTLQPVRRYGVDAAIVFSDILVIPEALGQPYSFREAGGIEMAHRITSEADVEALDVSRVIDHLSYVGDALRLVRSELDDTALIGFGGSPWTLATYMVEGGSSRDYRFAKRMFYERPDLFEALMSKITEATIAYFRLQVEAGVDAIQLFDSWGGVLAPHTFEAASAVWMKRIIDAVDGVPFIVFPKGAHENVEVLKRTGARCVGVSWTTPLAAVSDALGPGFSVQGNLDPIVVETTPEIARAQTRRLLDEMGDRRGHVFNLGHGISPHGKIECVEAMIDEIRS